MSGHVPALAALGCLALLLVLMLLSTDIYAFVSGRDAMPPAPPDPTAVQQTLQLRAALSAATHGALPPRKSATTLHLHCFGLRSQHYGPACGCRSTADA